MLNVTTGVCAATSSGISQIQSTAAERAEAAERARFMDLLRANRGKTEAEIHEMMRQTGRAA